MKIKFTLLGLLVFVLTSCNSQNPNKAKEPIDFASVDDKPVKTILLLVSPSNQTGPHIQALANISRLMLNDNFKQKLENSESAEQAYELISNSEKE